MLYLGVWLLTEGGLEVQVVVPIREAVIQHAVLRGQGVALGHRVVPRVVHRADPTAVSVENQDAILVLLSLCRCLW